MRVLGVKGGLRWQDPGCRMRYLLPKGIGASSVRLTGPMRRKVR